MIRFPPGPDGDRARAVHHAVVTAAAANPRQRLLASTALDITNAILALAARGLLAPADAARDKQLAGFLDDVENALDQKAPIQR